MIYYISIITLKYSFESGAKMHGCLSHEFEKAMQQCWTRRRVKRVLVCRTTHHERSGCILVQMLSFPSPCIYATRDETWHIRTWTLHHRGKYSRLKKPGERDKNVGQTKAYMGAFLGISTFYMKSRRGPCPHLPPSMWTHTDLFMDLMIFKLLGLPAQVGDVATFLFHANHWNCSRYWPRIFWMALTLIAKPVLPVLQLLAVLLQRPDCKAKLHFLSFHLKFYGFLLGCH